MLLLLQGDVVAWIVLLQGILVVVGAFGFWSVLLQYLYALPPLYALLWQFGLMCYGIITLRSLWMVRSGRGVMWKGRTYNQTSDIGSR